MKLELLKLELLKLIFRQLETLKLIISKVILINGASRRSLFRKSVSPF